MDHKLSDEARDRLLDGIARGVQRLVAYDRERFGSGVDVHLCSVEVALLDADGEALRVASLADVLGWVVGRQWADVGARDTCLGGAHDAHVIHGVSERCAEPGCGERHVDPCAECGRAPGEGAGDGCDTCDRLQRDSNGGESDEDEVRARVARLSRERVVALLTDASIQCYDHESDDELREALRVNVADGTISESDLHGESS